MKNPNLVHEPRKDERAVGSHGRIPEDKPALVRQVFAHLRRQDSGDMQGLSREGGLELERWLKGE